MVQYTHTYVYITTLHIYIYIHTPLHQKLEYTSIFLPKKKHAQKMDDLPVPPPSQQPNSAAARWFQVKAKQKVDMSKQLRVSKTQGRINGIMKLGASQLGGNRWLFLGPGKT